MNIAFIWLSFLLVCTGALETNFLPSNENAALRERSGKEDITGGSQSSKHGKSLEGQRQLQGGLPPGLAPEVGTFFVMATTIIPFLRDYETPITLRFTSYLDALTWNCIAAFSDNFLDGITKRRPAVSVPDPLLHVTSNRILCTAQAWTTFISLSIPRGLTTFVSTMRDVLDLPVDDAMTYSVKACGSTACLKNVASAAGYNPVTMGHIVAKQVYTYAIQDGYNQLGTDTGCKVSCRAYSDVSGYVPVNMPGFTTNINVIKNRWEPLMEDNGRGFFYRQEHVTPHIGKYAAFRHLPNSDRTSRTAAKPRYSKTRMREALSVIDRMTQLDDVKKIEVETFDDKLVTAVAVISSFLTFLGSSNFNDPDFETPNGYKVSFERAAHFIQGLTAAEHDAAIIAWKEKVSHDQIRPTSIIKKMTGNITTWSPGGIKTFPAKDFEAYARVMPHSEYVSGTSCLFMAVKEFTTSYTKQLGFQGDFPIVFPPVNAGMSKVEPGRVPRFSIQLEYPNVTAMAFAGDQSRLYGGMHFEQAVNAGATLCVGIGNIALAASQNLLG